MSTRLPTRAPVLVLLAGALLLAGPASIASAYDKPRGGKWNIQDSFGYTDGGAMSIAKDRGKLTKLVLFAGEDYLEQCGARRIQLTSRPKIKRFASAGGRWAVGRQQGGSTLIRPVPATFKLAGKKVKGKLLMLFDEDGLLAETAEVELPSCSLSFYARKAR